MSDLIRNNGGWVDEDWAVHDRTADGRHAFDEDAVLTPIFHALTRGGWRGRQHEAAAVRRDDPAVVFDRDPLTAPLPVQAPERSSRASRRRRAEGAHALAEVTAGRHHHARERVASLSRG